MHRSSFAAVAILATAVLSCGRRAVDLPRAESREPRAIASEPAESHLTNIRQLTTGGENAEAYFSADGRWITFQSTRDGRTCDQQYVMRADGSDVRRISNGLGKTTCGWFLPGADQLLFASSHAHDSTCPPRPDPSAGYVWPLDRFDIYAVDRSGENLRRVTH